MQIISYIKNEYNTSHIIPLYDICAILCLYMCQSILGAMYSLLAAKLLLAPRGSLAPAHRLFSPHVHLKVRLTPCGQAMNGKESFGMSQGEESPNN